MRTNLNRREFRVYFANCIRLSFQACADDAILKLYRLSCNFLHAFTAFGDAAEMAYFNLRPVYWSQLFKQDAILCNPVKVLMHNYHDYGKSNIEYYFG